MPYFVYGTDPKTGDTVSRFFATAATEADARQQAERQGVRVTAVVPSHSTSAIVLPELPPPQPTEAEVIRDETAAFDRTLEAITPRVVVTYWLIGANALVFLLMTALGVNPLAPSGADLLRWGAEYGPRTTDGESWRLFSSLFVHIGITHLVYNMIAFLYVARTVERMLGHVGFLLTYLVAGLAGGLWALIYNPTQIHAGASGAIFGIYGALLALLLRDRKTIPPHVLKQLRSFVIVFIIYNLVNSLRPQISMTAHVGGMVGGFLCGLVLATTFAAPARAGRTPRHLALALGGVVLCVGGIAVADARYPNLNPLITLLDRGYTAMAKFNAAQKKLSDADFATLIEHDLLPEWKATHAALTQLAPVPPGLQTNVEAIANYMVLRQQHWEALTNVLRQAKAGAWINQPVRMDTEEMDRRVNLQLAYTHAAVDLDFAKPNPSDHSGKLQRLQQLAGRVKALDDREHTENMRLDFDKFSAFLENDQLPELHNIQQAFADLSPLSHELEPDAAAMLDHLRDKQGEWEPRVAYSHYEHWRDEADKKRSQANDAARAIRDMRGARLLAPN